MITVLNNKASRYTQGGTTYFNKSNKIKWWERTIIPKSDDDIYIKVSQKYTARPDLIAFDLYGKPNLMWVVLQYNNIVDINDELVVGKTLRLPSKSRMVFNITNKKTGGVPE